MSLETRIIALVQAIGADIRAALNHVHEVRAVLPATFETSGPALAPTGLKVSLAPNRHYRIRGAFIAQSSRANTGTGFSFSGPAGVERIAALFHVPTSASACSALSLNAWLGGTSSPSSPGDNVDMFVVCEGVVVTSANGGDLKLHMRSENANPVRLLARSMLCVEAI